MVNLLLLTDEQQSLRTCQEQPSTRKRLQCRWLTHHKSLRPPTPFGTERRLPFVTRLIGACWKWYAFRLSQVRWRAVVPQGAQKSFARSSLMRGSPRAIRSLSRPSPTSRKDWDVPSWPYIDAWTNSTRAINLLLTPTLFQWDRLSDDVRDSPFHPCRILSGRFVYPITSCRLRHQVHGTSTKQLKLFLRFCKVCCHEELTHYWKLSIN